MALGNAVADGLAVAEGLAVGVAPGAPAGEVLAGVDAVEVAPVLLIPAVTVMPGAVLVAGGVAAPPKNDAMAAL